MEGIPSFDPSSAGSATTRQVPEDTLHYTIHLPPKDDSHNQTSPTPEAFAILITTYVESLLPGGKKWLWHKDSWELSVVPEQDIQDRRRRFGEIVDKVTQGEGADQSDEDDEGIPTISTATSSVLPRGRRLEGRMRIGDAVDDEWLVVWLLTRVSLKWPDLVISIRDTDGEFLLIEAADHLPRWLTPDNAENRFWLAKGHFHLVPPQFKSTNTRPRPFIQEEDEQDDDEMADGDSDGWLSEDDAVRILRGSLGNGQEATESKFWAGNSLENDILQRINGYPNALATHHQHTKAYLPVNIAKALTVSPDLVQRAVEGFYMRDPAQLRAAARTTRFPPSPSTSIVLAPVTMTRVAYAQLKGQVFHPPRTFGNEWRIPPADDASKEKATTEEEKQAREDEWRWRDLGIKIIMGFEIMYREDNRRSKSKPDEGDSSIEGVDEKDPTYSRYIANLQKAGFFGEEMQGSKGWKERMQDAKKGWLTVRNDSESRVSFAEAVDSALKSTMTLDISELAPADTYQEDSESWLEISPDELDGLLSRSGQAEAKPPASADRDTGKGEVGKDDDADAQAKTLSDLAKKVGAFVEGQGDLDGARFEDELSDDDDFMADSDDESDHERSMEVDPILTEQQKHDRLQALVPGLKPEEWGRQTQDLTALTSATEKKGVKFATGTKIESVQDRTKQTKAESEDAVVEKARKSRFEPTDYEGHVVETDDETDEEDGGEQTMPGWTAQKGNSSNQKRKAPIDPAIYQLSEALRTGKVGPIEGWKDRTEQEDLEMSDREGEDEDVVEGDIDMGQEEEEFLKFARDALGIDESMWSGMLEERKSRGAYVPGDVIDAQNASTAAFSAAHQPSNEPAYKPPAKATEIVPPKPSFSVANETPAGERNPDLDSFERVMEAMEAELAKAKAQAAAPAQTAPKESTTKLKGKGKASSKAPPAASANPLPNLPTEEDLEAMDEDDLIAMDRELRAALKSAGISDDEASDDDEDMDDETRAGLHGLTDDAKGEFKMMKDFLESYKAQGGQSGVVGNLFGRLGGK
ncbi:hypothetical protein QFC22_003218 [Naganishia vaughanmartiniae]|uniref:Uncharacterized protein n=1 Tax=Naganishia vaughanmartiniae TaxID=1424756 RepID=A0ACC2X7D3_9TREE|nr:hypothetical protein QFC22_003218 [Naganishia vaughanmartiniae]